MIVVLLVLLTSASQLCHASKQLIPNAPPLCASSPGGMFGYSLASVTRADHTWLAIGEPWSSKVHVYKTPHTNVRVTLVNVTSQVTTCTDPASSSVYTLTATATGTPPQCTTTSKTAEKVDFSYNTTSPVQWTLVATLTDANELDSTGGAVWDGTSNGSGRSLYGFDVALSLDGTWLAVGVPGRTLVSFSQFGVRTLAWHPYHGSVMIYKMNPTSITFHSQLQLSQLSLAPQYFDRFGSKLKFSPDLVADRLHLFIGSNGGWDGVSKPGGLTSMGAPPAYGQSSWPSLPTSSTANLGVGIFKFASSSNTWDPVQFLSADSPIPLGTIGMDFDVSGTGARDCVLVMRGYNSESPGGLVVVYRQDVNRFVKVQRITQPLQRVYQPVQQDPLFGVGLNVFVQDQLGVLHVGAPSTNEVLRYVTRRPGIWDDWVLDGIRENPVNVYVPGHNFFGGTLASIGRLVFASDAAGASGRGNVYMWHRRAPGVAVSGFEDVLREPTPTTNGGSSSLLEYDFVGVLKMPSNLMDGIYNADQFGKAVTASGNVVLAGAPVNGCVYTFPVPVSYPIPGWVNNVILPTNSIIQSPTPTVPPGERVSNDQTILYSIIGSVAGVVVFVPIAIYTAMRYHKTKLLSQLQVSAQSPNSLAPLNMGGL